MASQIACSEIGKSLVFSGDIGSEASNNYIYIPLVPGVCECKIISYGDAQLGAVDDETGPICSRMDHVTPLLILISSVDAN